MTSTSDYTLSQVSELSETIRKLKAHIQQLKSDGFKVVADCESLGILVNELGVRKE